MLTCRAQICTLSDLSIQSQDLINKLQGQIDLQNIEIEEYKKALEDKAPEILQTIESCSSIKQGSFNNKSMRKLTKDLKIGSLLKQEFSLQTMGERKEGTPANSIFLSQNQTPKFLRLGQENLPTQESSYMPSFQPKGLKTQVLQSDQKKKRTLGEN